MVNDHTYHSATEFTVSVKEGQYKLPTFIANSEPFTTTELSKLLTSCLTAIRKHVIKYCDTFYERSGKESVLVY